MPRVSRHDFEGFDAAAYASGFDTVEVETLLELANIVLQDVWSPCVWRDGRRSKATFVGSDFWAFDFDEGKTIAEVSAAMQRAELAHLIGTTKSHQKPKQSGASIKPPCDRFRLLIPMHEPIDDLDTFEYNMRRAIERMGCDKSCKDGGRLYYPCAEVVAVRPGRPLRWSDVPPHRPSAAELAHRSRYVATRNASLGYIPRWIRALLRDGVPPGGRHVACYRLGANLTNYGFSASDIVRLAMDSPLSEIGAEDVERAVRNGIAKAASEGGQKD